MKKQNVLRMFQRKFSSLLWWGGEHAFVATLGFVVLALVLFGLVFWQYSIKPGGENIATQQARVRFESKKFQEITFQLEEDARRFETTDSLEPRDIFFP